MPPVPKATRLLTGITSAIVLLTAILFTALTVIKSTQPPMVLGFEPVVAGACVFGFLFAKGKFGWAPAMTLLCIAGTILLPTVISYKALGGQIEIQGRAQGMSLLPWLVARGGGAAVLLALAGAHVLSRSREAKQSFRRGLIAAVPMVIALAAFVAVWRNARASNAAVVPTAPGAATAANPATPAAASSGMPSWASTGLLVILGVVAGVAACASGHYMIRALEIGTDAGEPGRANGLHAGGTGRA